MMYSIAFFPGRPNYPAFVAQVPRGLQPPLMVSADDTRCVIRDPGGNEIAMESAEGAERMRLHSPVHDTTLVLGNSITGVTTSFAKWLVGADWMAEIAGSKRIKVQGNWHELVNGFKSVTIDGLSQTTIGGAEIKNVTGVKVEKITGSETKINLINKNDLIAGLTTKLQKGGRIEKQPELMERSTTKLARIEKELKKEDDLKELISGICDQNIGTVNQKITSMTQDISQLRAKVGSLEIQAKSYEVHGDNIFLDSADQVKAIASELMLKGQLKQKGKSNFDNKLQID